MSQRLRSQRGQIAAEYMGLLLVVALVIGALVAGGVAEKIAGGVERAVCTVVGGDCGGNSAAASAPAEPSASDRDGDGVANADEARQGTDPDASDSDGDGVADGAERARGADPTVADTDGDGLSDGDELAGDSGLDPARADSDGDGLTDAEEIAAETDPTEADSDGAFGSPNDGLTDAEEVRLGTDPNAYDTDRDGYPDGHEVEHGTDPLEDERSLVEKGFETLFLDDPISAVLPSGKVGSGAKKVVDDLLGGGGKGVARIGGAETIEDAAKIRRDRIDAVRDRVPDPPRPVAPAKRDSGETVLGKYPAYVELSDQRNARRFQIPDEAWERMTDAERWAANQRFLDRTIARGDDIVLATPIDKVKPTGYFAREVEYLLSKGYTVSPDGKRLVKPEP